METCSDAVMVSQAQAHHDHQSIRSDAADDDDDGEREREERGVHEKVTCSFMPIAETKAENHPWMLMQQLV
jgi:hypothetical protein